MLLIPHKKCSLTVLVVKCTFYVEMHKGGLIFKEKKVFQVQKWSSVGLIFIKLGLPDKLWTLSLLVYFPAAGPYPVNPINTTICILHVRSVLVTAKGVVYL